MNSEAMVVIFVALAVGAMVKGITGLGLPLVAIPVMAGFIGVERAVILMLVPGIVLNFGLLWIYRAHATALAKLPVILVVAAIGTMLGAWGLSAVPERVIMMFMVAWIGLYLLKLLLVKSEIQLPQPLQRYFSTLVMFLAGMIQGATGTGGPVLAIYCHALKLSQPAFVFVVTVLIQAMMFTQAGTYWRLGMFTMDRLYDGMLACVPVAIFLPVGVYISRFISQRHFSAVIIVLLLVIEARMIGALLET